MSGLHAVGSTVVVQEVWGGRVWAARPMRVVHDDGSLTALWFPGGTRWQAPTPRVARDGEHTRAARLSRALLENDWVFVEREWDAHNLQLWRPGAWHAMWVSWLPSGEHWGWYVNLQRPYERTALGFRTMDLVLDVLVDPDLTWRLKDAEELELFARRGVFDAELDARIRAEAQRVIGDVEAGLPPFCEDWPAWRPEPGWPLPELPEGWDECR